MKSVGLIVLLTASSAACSLGAPVDVGPSAGVGMGAHETEGIATAGDDESEGSDTDTGTGGAVPADFEEIDSSTSAADGLDSDSSGDGESGGSSDEGGAAVGDPQCPPGFLVAFDITDADADQMGQHEGWLSDILFDRSSRISFEVWSAGVEHYGPIIWNTSGYASAFDAFASGSGPMTGIVSEDAGWRMSLAPTDTFVFLTAADDDPQAGGAHLFGWLAPQYTHNDEIFGINAPYPGAYSDRYESGDRWVACYDPAS